MGKNVSTFLQPSIYTKRRNVIMFGEVVGRFDNTLEFYNLLIERKVDILYHYLLQKDVSIMNGLDAVTMIRSELEQNGQANFDLPMLASISGIKIIGYGPTKDMVDVTNENVLANAISICDKFDHDNIAIVVPDMCIEDNEEFIKNAIPGIRIVRG